MYQSCLAVPRSSFPQQQNHEYNQSTLKQETEYWYLYPNLEMIVTVTMRGLNCIENGTKMFLEGNIYQYIPVQHSLVENYLTIAAYYDQKDRDLLNQIGILRSEERVTRLPPTPVGLL